MRTTIIGVLAITAAFNPTVLGIVLALWFLATLAVWTLRAINNALDEHDSQM
jgi:hypothetical protein